MINALISNANQCLRGLLKPSQEMKELQNFVYKQAEKSPIPDDEASIEMFHELVKKCIGQQEFESIQTLYHILEKQHDDLLLESVGVVDILIDPYQKIATEILNECERSGKRIVYLFGGSGSGKSSIVKNLTQLQKDIVTLDMDEFLVSKAERRERKVTSQSWESRDAEFLAHAITAVVEGGTFLVPIYNRSKDEPSKGLQKTTILPGQRVVIDSGAPLDNCPFPLPPDEILHVGILPSIAKLPYRRVTREFHRQILAGHSLTSIPFNALQLWRDSVRTSLPAYTTFILPYLKKVDMLWGQEENTLYRR